MDFGICKVNGWSDLEYSHIDSERYGDFEDSVCIKLEGTYSRQKRNLSGKLKTHYHCL